jgi:hypothetical protein
MYALLAWMLQSSLRLIAKSFLRGPVFLVGVIVGGQTTLGMIFLAYLAMFHHTFQHNDQQLYGPVVQVPGFVTCECLRRLQVAHQIHIVLLPEMTRSAHACMRRTRLAVLQEVPQIIGDLL